MVSKASDDLPEPLRPVTTTRLSRGISSEMFLRLWTRAPCTAMVVRAAVLGVSLPRTRLLFGIFSFCFNLPGADQVCQSRQGFVQLLLTRFGHLDLRFPIDI